VTGINLFYILMTIRDASAQKIIANAQSGKECAGGIYARRGFYINREREDGKNKCFPRFYRRWASILITTGTGTTKNASILATTKNRNIYLTHISHIAAF
jgi:hypothetical protein